MNVNFKAQFPFFAQHPDWVYLDSAATTLKPQVLLDATKEFYTSAGSVHRSQYDLAQTRAFERARDLVAQRFNAQREGVIWTSGTTHALNLVAQGLAHQIAAGDEIVISVAEHHANFITWQQLAQQCGAKLVVLPLNAAYALDLSALKTVLSSRTKVVAFNLVSNVTGIRQPAEQLIPLIRQHSNAQIVLDIAQAVCSEKVDTRALDADFYTFSAHKMYGPTGVGCLIGKVERLNALRPLFYGGKMLKTVSESTLSLADLPYRLEAGTPNIAGIIGFGAVLEWLNGWDMLSLNHALYALAEQARRRLKTIEDLHIFGENGTTISFNIHGIHPADLAAFLTESQIAIRHGEHCAQPYLRYLAQTGTVRLSLAHYNQPSDLDSFFNALAQALALLK